MGCSPSNFSIGFSISELPQPLPRSFYARPVLRVARDCVGKLLISTEQGLVRAGRIVEAEAYRGPEDRAAHSHGGRRTARTEAMFGQAGHAYVFLIYGLHYNFNVVTGEPGQPEAVLIRAVEPLQGQSLMAKLRGKPSNSQLLTNGPGKLCQAFGINRRHYGRDLTSGSLYLAHGWRRGIRRSPRIGIDYAGSWASKPWRFFEPDNTWVSRAPRVKTNK